MDSWGAHWADHLYRQYHHYQTAVLRLYDAPDGAPDARALLAAADREQRKTDRLCRQIHQHRDTLMGRSRRRTRV